MSNIACSLDTSTFVIIYYNYTTPFKGLSKVGRTRKFDNTTGIHDIKMNTFKLFPNPTAQLINLKFDEVSQNTKIQLTNLSRQLFYEKAISSYSTFTVYLSNFEKGVYILSVISNGSISTIKIIKIEEYSYAF